MIGKIPNILLLLDTSRACGRGLMLGVAQYARQYGPWALSKTQPNYTFSHDSSILPWKGTAVDGVILSDTRYVRHFKKITAAVIVVDEKNQWPDLPNVIGDCEQIGIAAAEYFLDRKFSHFAFCGYDNIHWSSERGESFRKTLEKKGFAVDFYKEPSRARVSSDELRRKHLAHWLESLPKPVAIMACNDDRSQTITEACKISGLRVPDEVAVIGVDNDELICNFTNPTLSSIGLNFEKAGFEAAQVLHRMMNGRKTFFQKIVIKPTRIITRESTDILMVADSVVAQAMRLIQANSKSDIHVPDLVEAVGCGRRNLERRFKKTVGISINEKIRKERVKQIITMLLETDLTITQIATILGYSGIANISRYFKSQIGQSLIAYRKQHRIKNEFGRS